MQFDRDHWLPIVLSARCHDPENALLATRWKESGLTAPCQVFNTRVDPQHPPTFNEAALMLADAWALPLAAAAPLLETELFYLSFTFGKSSRTQQTAWETARFEKALSTSSAREIKLALIGVVCFYGDGMLPLLDRVLRASTDRTALSREMMRCGGAAQALAVSTLLRDDALAWGDVTPVLIEKHASLDLLLTVLETGEKAEPASPLLVSLRRKIIRSALSEDLPGLALALWKETSAQTRAALLVPSATPDSHALTPLVIALLAAQEGDVLLSRALAPSTSVTDWSTTD